MARPDDDLEDPLALNENRARAWCEVRRVPWAEFEALRRTTTLARTTRWSQSRGAFISRTVDGREHKIALWDHASQRMIEVIEPAEIVYAPGWLPAEAAPDPRRR